MRKEKSLGTGELGCLAKYIISHLALQVKIDSLSPNINIYEINGIMFHLEGRFGKNATSICQLRLLGLLHTDVGMSLIQKVNLQLA